MEANRKAKPAKPAPAIADSEAAEARASAKAAKAKAAKPAKAKAAKPAAPAAAKHELPADGSIPAFLKREKAPAKQPAAGSKEEALRRAREKHLADVAKATKVKPAKPAKQAESPTTNAHAKDALREQLNASIKAADEAARKKAAAFKNGKAASPVSSKPERKAKPAGNGGPPRDRARFDWKGAEEAAKRGKMPGKLDFSADTHTRFRPALAEVEKLAAAKNVKGLKNYEWPGFVSSSPKAILRWRDICVTALSSK
jgi:hypothetical protein